MQLFYSFELICSSVWSRVCSWVVLVWFLFVFYCSRNYRLFIVVLWKCLGNDLFFLFFFASLVGSSSKKKKSKKLLFNPWVNGNSLYSRVFNSVLGLGMFLMHLCIYCRLCRSSKGAQVFCKDMERVVTHNQFLNYKLGFYGSQNTV